MKTRLALGASVATVSVLVAIAARAADVSCLRGTWSTEGGSALTSSFQPEAYRSTLSLDPAADGGYSLLRLTLVLHHDTIEVSTRGVFENGVLVFEADVPSSGISDVVAGARVKPRKIRARYALGRDDRSAFLS